MHLLANSFVGCLITGKFLDGLTPPSKTAQKRKRQGVSTGISEEEYMQKIEIKLTPDELKHWIVDDWDLINRQKKLLELPACVSVETILAEYVKSRTSVRGIMPNKERAIIEAVNGIRGYFNAMLGKQLLYKFERPQYNKLMSENSDSTPSQIYGAIHLIRLFTKIGGPLSNTSVDEESINILYDFMKYLSECRTCLFSVSDYAPASQEYLKKAG